MSRKTAFPNMHDWTFVSIEYDWKEAVAKAHFKTFESPICLTVSNATQLDLTQDHAWGPSVSVLETTGPTLDDAGRSRLTIAMQSGDIITIKGSVFTFD